MKSVGRKRKSIFFSVIFLLIQNSQSDGNARCNEYPKPTNLYPYCMEDESAAIIWCDQSAHQRIPKTSEHRVIDTDTAAKAKIMYINESCLTEIKREDLAGYTILEVFIGSGNLLKSLSGGTFFQKDTLKHIDLSRNEIQTIEKNTFEGLSRLIYLDLSDNEINFIPDGTWDDLQALRTLRLDGNKLRGIPTGFFRGLNKLKILHLRGNEIKTVDGSAFSNLRNIEEVIIASNKIEKWPKVLGTTLRNLKVLDLSGNFIRKFTLKHIKELRGLRYLSLKNNSLKAVEENLFLTTPDLKFLSLGSNFLSSIPENAFDSLRSIETLLLGNNQLVDPHKRWFKNLANCSHAKVDIANNKWNCECEILEFQWFVIALENQNLANQLAIHCHRPKRMETMILGVGSWDVMKDEVKCEFAKPRPQIRIPVTTSIAPRKRLRPTTTETPAEVHSTQHAAVEKSSSRMRMSRSFYKLQTLIQHAEPISETNSTKSLIIGSVVVGVLLAVLIVVLIAGRVRLISRNVAWSKQKKRLDSTSSTSPCLQEETLEQEMDDAGENYLPTSARDDYDAYIPMKLAPSSFSNLSQEILGQYRTRTTVPKTLFTTSGTICNETTWKVGILKSKSNESFQSCTDFTNNFYSAPHPSADDTHKVAVTVPPSNAEYIPANSRGCPDGAESHIRA